MASFAVSFQSPVLVDRSGFMAGLTSVPFSRGVHDVVRCGSVAFLPGMPDIRCFGVCLMSWSICNHECKDPLFGQVSNCKDT